MRPTIHSSALAGISILLAACGRTDTTAMSGPTVSTRATASMPSTLTPAWTPTSSPVSPGVDGLPSLASLVESQESFLMSGATMNLVPAAEPVAVSVNYSSRLRPIDPETKAFLLQFGVSFDHPDFEAPFERELLVREADLEFWMPLPEETAAGMMELAAGEELILFVRLLGSLQAETGYRVIFIITDIQE